MYERKSGALSTGERFSFYRVANDVNGNGRHMVSWLTLIPEGTYSLSFGEVHAAALRVGGSKYRAKWYGGGIVFQCYECQLAGLVERVRSILAGREEVVA